MEIEVLKSKIHRAVITEANLQYVGSLTLDEDLMDAANLIENEKKIESFSVFHLQLYTKFVRTITDVLFSGVTRIFRYAITQV